MDIEDIMPHETKMDYKHKNGNGIKMKVKLDDGSDILDRNTSKLSNVNGGIPGSQKIYIKTWGCSHNVSDSEYMAGLLIKDGYQVTLNESECNNADLWILNSCTVKGRAQNLFESALKKAKLLGKYIIAAGCVPSGDKYNKLWSNVSIIGVQQIDQIGYIVQQTIKGNKVQLLKHKKLNNKKLGGSKLSMPKLRKNKLEEIIPINTGCLNNCTYCKTKHARGDLASYPIDDIINRIKEVLKEGIQIINLESEDTGAYGLDIGTNINELLQTIKLEILNNNELSQNMMLRLGISNPPYFLKHAKNVCEILKHDKVFTYIHIPVQSGSNQVLFDMKRKYTIQEFNKLCNIFLHEIPNIHIATDIIVGFPTETQERWNKTMELCKQYKFKTIYISPFFPRPGTIAAKMRYEYGNNHYVSVDRIKKDRVKEITNLCNSFKSYENEIGKTHFWIGVYDVAKDGIHYPGFNKYGVKVFVKPPKNTNLMGKIIKIIITSVTNKHLYGKVHPDYIPLLALYPNIKNYIQHKQMKQLRTKNMHITIISVIIVFITFFLSKYYIG